ncbi:hypothetical protein [Bauldia litoralis]|uniref:hypothetical protein n=1 Tax=Bauldia litoralis TaxID=665467 RepID=UPI003266D3BF
MKRSTPGLDPKDILRHAMAFQHSARRLAEKRPGDDDIWPLFAHPYMVLVALSAELYLKCTHCIDSTETPWGHPLDILYADLPALRRNRIAFHWEKLNSQPELVRRRAQLAAQGMHIPDDLPTVLRDCGNAFEVVRYIYEHPNGTKFYGIDTLPEAVRQTIIEIHPDLAALSFPGIKKLGP